MTIAKVLIVENEEFNARFLTSELQKLDYEVCGVFTTGEEAIEKVSHLQPDLILMDISLDGALDGIDAAERIAALRPTPLIFLSGYTDDATLQRARQTKPYGYLVKPYGGQTLNATLQILMERLQTEHALRRTETSLREAALVFDATQDGILILDAARKIVRLNQRFTAITGFDQTDVSDATPEVLNRDTLTAALFEQIDTDTESERWSSHMDIRKKDGTYFPANVTIAGMRNTSQSHSTSIDGHPNNYVVLISDLTAVRMAEEKLYRMAHHDPLTGLPNRQLAIDRLHQAIEQAKRRRTRIAVFFIDLDHFKRINDSLGHNAGDDLLRAVAMRMQSCVRSVDTVARLGGDEFLVILDNIDDIKTVSGIARKILDAVARPVTSRHTFTEIVSSGSIGISLFPEAGKNPDHLIRAADTAMYHAKSRGRSNYAFYTLRMTYSAAQRVQIKHELEHAIEQQQFELYYQPQVRIANNELVGLEALLRWRHPRRGLLSAEQVIPLAESADCMREIGAWVLRTVCAQLKDWRERGFKIPKTSLNFSSVQLFDKDFVSALEHCLQEFELPPQLLELEITESTLHQEEVHREIFARMKALDVGLAIDDFGTGHFNVHTLNRQDIRRVKIDRRLVQGIADKENLTVINAILAMTKHLNLISVAKGVETVEQSRFLAAHGCDEAQGWFYSDAQPVQNIEQILRRVAVAAEVTG